VFRFRLWGLRAELEGFTIHGREPRDAPPLFHADLVVVDVRVDSLLGRKIALDGLWVERPNVNVRVSPDGQSNVPKPRISAPGAKPWQERIFELAISRLRINDGEIRYNDGRVPLAVEGGRFQFALDYHATVAGQDFYEGKMAWRGMVLKARRYVPNESDIAAEFKLERDRFELTKLRWKLPKSEFEASGALAGFAKPAGTFRYRGSLSLAELGTALRKPSTPTGEVHFSGEGSYADGRVSASGEYAARNIQMAYKWFHTTGISSTGHYRIKNGGLEVPDFEATALGGKVRGRVRLDFGGLSFRVDSRAEGLSLAAILSAVDNSDLPVAALHWDGSVEVESVTTWSRDFKHVESRGRSRWLPPGGAEARGIPASAHLEYHYVMDRRTLELREGMIRTPSSGVQMDGRLGIRDSALNVRMNIEDLLPWNDFIHRLRGPAAEKKRITGRVEWRGRVLGGLGQPTFVGHVKGSQAAYGTLYWDELEGDLTYSPEQFRFERAHAVRGYSSAELELRLELDNWSFGPENNWILEASLVRAATDDLQSLLGSSYPVRGLLTGRFRGGGTRADPEISGVAELSDVEAWGLRLDRAQAELRLSKNELRITKGEIIRANGRITGNLLFRPLDKHVTFDVTGTTLPLDRIMKLENGRIPLRGSLSFVVTGEGPVRALIGQGTLRLVDLQFGEGHIGTFEGQLRSDGQRLHVDLKSAMVAAKLEGRLDVSLGGDYPLGGDLTVEGMDLDPFLQRLFRLKAFTGHSQADGRFRLTGSLARPETITVEADISSLKFDYQHLKLENLGPLRLIYGGEEVRIERAHIRGPDTDLTVDGHARFGADSQLELRLAGTMNLRLGSGFLPELEARGTAQVDMAIHGTLSAPRITGRLRLEDATANYADFPIGLSRVKGDFVFDRSRLVFENVTTEAGGGQLILSGTVTYQEGPPRYDLTAQANKVRIRYPTGMSWLGSGTLRLSGTAQAGLLSGRVVVDQVLMAQGFDLASLITVPSGNLRAPTARSPYLRNLQFDIEALSSPSARIEWSGARFQNEANLRVRGTWEHPILLGHIHLLTGEINFRGNRYRLTRGDLNFANPFRIDPVLNIEATTTIQQYEVALNFNGPASRLTLSYRSDPPLPTSDIIALLALGRTGEESELRTPTPVQSPEVGATTLLSEAISSQIGGRLSRLFGVTRFKVDPFLAGTGGEQNASARITIEQQVTRALTVTYITNVTSTQQQVIQFEYAVNRDVSIVGLRDQNGTFGLDVKFRKRFR
jgi:translocation and assembly module TamB